MHLCLGRGYCSRAPRARRSNSPQIRATRVSKRCETGPRIAVGLWMDDNRIRFTRCNAGPGAFRPAVRDSRLMPSVTSTRHLLFAFAPQPARPAAVHYALDVVRRGPMQPVNTCFVLRAALCLYVRQSPLRDRDGVVVRAGILRPRAIHPCLHQRTSPRACNNHIGSPMHACDARLQLETGTHTQSPAPLCDLSVLRWRPEKRCRDRQCCSPVQ
jgi:hypothetical protein